MALPELPIIGAPDVDKKLETLFRGQMAILAIQEELTQRVSALEEMVVYEGDVDDRD